VTAPIVMEVECRGLIFDATNRPKNQQVNAFTSLCSLQSGTILAGFHSGPSKHAPNSTIRLCRSQDEGRTWNELPDTFVTKLDGVPGSLSSGDIVEPEPGKLVLFGSWFDRSDPSKPFFDPVSEGLLHCKQIWAVSTDEGQSWGPWNILPTPGLTGCGSTGPVLAWADGTIAHAFESFKEFDDPNPGRHGAWLAISRDRGRTFPEFHLVAQDPEHKVYYWDQRLCAGRAPGEYYAMFWTHDLARKEDLHVHFRKGSIDEATDHRSAPVATTIPGQIAAPLLLEDGRLLAFVVDRNHPGTLKLWSSRDDGVTWPTQDSLVIHTHDERALLSQSTQDIDFKQYWEDMAKWTFGHPAILPLRGERVLLAYYAGVPGTLSIHFACVKIAEGAH